MQAENRHETLWRSKQNTEFAAHENWVQTDKKRPGAVPGRACLTQATQVRCWRWPVPAPYPGTTRGQPASLSRGRDRSRTQTLAEGHRPQQGSSFLRSKPHLCTGASLPFGPPRSPTTNARSEEPGGPGDPGTAGWGPGE